MVEHRTIHSADVCRKTLKMLLPIEIMVDRRSEYFEDQLLNREVRTPICSVCQQFLLHLSHDCMHRYLAGLTCDILFEVIRHTAAACLIYSRRMATPHLRQ